MFSEECSCIQERQESNKTEQLRTYPQHFTSRLNSLFKAPKASKLNFPKLGWSLSRCQASTGVNSPLRLMLLLNFKSSLIMAALADHWVFDCGGALELATRGVEASKMWLEGSWDFPLG